jgi:hypothetical protein
VTLLPRNWRLPVDLARAWDTAVERAVAERWSERLWARDASLWTASGEERWLGWLDAPERERRDLAALASLRGGGAVLLLGMGGSSLAPEVLASVFGARRFAILDSTDPGEVAARAAAFDDALFVVASKSGSTLEPSVLFDYFWGRHPDGARFLAITDPGSELEALARARGLGAVFHGEPSIGGRYSVLSKFGLVPAALQSVDVAGLLEHAAAMAAACRLPDAGNPGLALGLVLGVGAASGRDKLTLVCGPPFADLGSWLEQLVAESTGKQGRAIVPIEGEALVAPARAGEDRLFVALDPTPEQARGLDALAAAGQPVVVLEIGERLALGAEFFRWEIATAIAGAVLGINPFDQPDVEASKVETRKLTDAYERDGILPADSGAVAAEDVAALRAYFAQLGPGDYAAVLAYVERDPLHAAVLQRLRHRLRDRYRVATCLGFGPRFLHSTGQAYKGGPNSGVFLQITCDDAHDLAIPGRRSTFGVIKAAQARGDLAVLRERGRRALRVHLRADVAAELETLDRSVAAALS